MHRGSGWVSAAIGLALLAGGCGGGGGGGNSGSGCGPVESTPKVCRLSVSPNPAREGGLIRVSFGISDLEGDINQLCVGLAEVDGPSATECGVLPTAGETVDERVTTDPFAHELPAGTYILSVGVGDAAGHMSEVPTTTFRVVR
jgi:hypothetical protein